MKALTLVPQLGAWLAALLYLAPQPALAAAESDLGDKAKEAWRETSQAVQKAGDAAADKFHEIWMRIDEARLKNRTKDQLVAWLIMGLLVGGVAGSMTTLKPTGFGKMGRWLLGLAGAFLGGIVVSVAQFDFGWGPVLIRYEELLFAFVGAVVLLGIGRLIRSRMKKEKHLE